jgi:hypothetical protein
VDGTPWAREAVGALKADGLLEPTDSPVKLRRILIVHVLCSGSTIGGDRGLTPGAHSAMLVAYIAGGATVVSPVLGFNLDCYAGTDGSPPNVVGTARPPLESAPLSTVQPADGGMTNGEPDAGTSRAGADPAPVTTNSATDPAPSPRGCSSSGGAPALWALLALGMFGRARGHLGRRRT